VANGPLSGRTCYHKAHESWPSQLRRPFESRKCRMSLKATSNSGASGLSPKECFLLMSCHRKRAAKRGTLGWKRKPRLMPLRFCNGSLSGRNRQLLISRAIGERRVDASIQLQCRRLIPTLFWWEQLQVEYGDQLTAVRTSFLSPIARWIWRSARSHSHRRTVRSFMLAWAIKTAATWELAFCAQPMPASPGAESAIARFLPMD